MVYKVNPLRPECEIIRAAAKVIREGGIVAFPTETVYGLGVNALDPEAVKKVYEVKRRPADNPTIVHIADKMEAQRLAAEIPEIGYELMERFWPGPLTLVLKKSEIVPSITVAGLDTVAVRIPKHRVALMLIKEAGVPVAAPSANLAGKPSPTLAEHVIRDLDGKIDMVLDGGPTEIGVESTVLDLTTPQPLVLRPGGVTLEELRRVLREVQLHPVAVTMEKLNHELARSPGMKHKHYAPNAEMILVEGERRERVKERIRELVEEYVGKGLKVGVLVAGRWESSVGHEVRILGPEKDLKTIAKNLFKALRELDEKKVDIIVAGDVNFEGLGLAVMNRLRKASGYRILKA
ncbi:MAG: L-threonylcarbamoyladenylate synthase [Candidatus Bathyarchaeia archaeon]